MNLKYLFLHVDEAMYCKLIMIKRLNKGLNDKNIPTFTLQFQISYKEKEISYSWIREHFSELPPSFYSPPRSLIFRLSVGPPPFC